MDELFFFGSANHFRYNLNKMMAVKMFNTKARNVPMMAMTPQISKAVVLSLQMGVALWIGVTDTTTDTIDRNNKIKIMTHRPLNRS